MKKYKRVLDFDDIYDLPVGREIGDRIFSDPSRPTRVDV